MSARRWASKGISSGASVLAHGVMAAGAALLLAPRYSFLRGASESRAKEMALLWVLNLCDGTYSLLDIAERSGLPFSDIRDAAVLLQHHALLQERNFDETPR